MKKLLLSILTFTAFSFGANAQTFSDSLLSNNSTNARTIVSADIDGDGDLDLLTSAQGGAELAWFDNTDGQGSFGSKIIIANVSTIYMALAGDMDGDNDLDVVVVSNGTDRVIWYENTDGAGTFSTGTIITTLTNGATSLELADIDGDNDLDILSTSYLDDKLAYYINDGSGVFGTQNIISSTMDGAIYVHAADMDNDGDMDLLAAASLGNIVSYFENNGGLIFSAPVTITATASAVTSVISTDIDGDNDLDVVVSYSGNDKVVWFANTNGTGVFGTEQIISSIADRPFKVDAADLDNDGDMDVLSANFNDAEIVWYENTNGAGSFGLAQVISTTAQGASFVSTADIDNDGDMDVLSASYNNSSFNWYRNSLISTGVNDVANKNFMAVYPNPTTSILTIDIQEKINVLTIVDITGKSVETFIPTQNTVDVSDLVKGIYFLQIQTNTGIANSKFIKE
jgi:hypothetical protein